MTDDTRRANMSERLGILDAKVSAAHTRVDKLELVIRDDLKGIREDLKELNAYMHRGRGWAGAMIFLSGLLGAGVFKFFSVLIK